MGLGSGWFNKIPIYPKLYLLKGDYILNPKPHILECRFGELGWVVLWCADSFF